MNFTLHSYYKECLDVNYDPLYINRYTDSLSVLNSLDITNTMETNKLYFNFIDIYNNDLGDDIVEHVKTNVSQSDEKLAELLFAINEKDNNILFNNKIFFFRNIKDFIENKSNLFELEEYIENLFPKSYLVLRSDFDLSVMGYEVIYRNHYIKRLY